MGFRGCHADCDYSLFCCQSSALYASARGQLLLPGVHAYGVTRGVNAKQVTGGLPEDSPEVPAAPTVKGHELRGGPQMIQLR